MEFSAWLGEGEPEAAQAVGENMWHAALTSVDGYVVRVCLAGDGGVAQSAPSCNYVCFHVVALWRCATMVRAPPGPHLLWPWPGKRGCQG